MEWLLNGLNFFSTKAVTVAQNLKDTAQKLCHVITNLASAVFKKAMNKLECQSNFYTGLDSPQFCKPNTQLPSLKNASQLTAKINPWVCAFLNKGY